jgi:hypothetical protein
VGKVVKSKNFTYDATGLRSDCRTRVMCAILVLAYPMKPAYKDRLGCLQSGDSFREWHSLDDQRVCILCDEIITGRLIKITETADRSHELRCPTRGCRGTPRDWVHPGNPLISEIAYQDWWRALGEGEVSSAREAGASA